MVVLDRNYAETDACFLGFTLKTDTKSKGGPLRTLIDQVDGLPVSDEGLVRSMVPPMSSKGLSKIRMKMVHKLPKYLGKFLFTCSWNISVRIQTLFIFCSELKQLFADHIPDHQSIGPAEV